MRLPFETMYGVINFVKGIGALNNYYSYVQPNYVYEEWLSYYQKGGTAWGTPHIVGMEQRKPRDLSFTLYPNPAHDNCIIQLSAYAGALRYRFRS